MAINKIYEIFLYTTDIVNPVECHQAKAWLDHSNIDYKWLNYNDINQLPEVIKALNTWWSGKELAQWPFVVYRYQKDGEPFGYITSDFIEGVENIKSQLPEIILSSQN